MATPTANTERERLLKLADEYRDKGYAVSFHPIPEDLPDFLRSYRPDMIVRRGEEAVVIEVKSRSSLNSSSTQYLRNLAQAVEQHPGWRFELVVTNPDDTTYSQKAEGSFQEHEIRSRLQVAILRTNLSSDNAVITEGGIVRVRFNHTRLQIQVCNKSVEEMLIKRSSLHTGHGERHPLHP